MFETSLLFADSQPVATDKIVGAGWFSALKLKSVLPYLFAVSGLLWSGWGLWLVLAGGAVAAEGQATSPTDPIIIATNPEVIELVVDVSGAVVSPGIYSVLDGNRVADALDLAGGVTAQADLAYLQSTLNLASRVSDEQKIYVPFIEKTQPLETLATDDLATNLSDIDQLSVNFATKAELVKLPKIGEVTAEKIIAGRPYQSTNELLTSGVVTEAVWRQIKDQLKL